MTRSTSLEGPHPVDLHVGRRVSERRLELGYTQSDLAAALALTFQQIQKYEKGANRISASRLWQIAEFLKLDIGDLYAGLVSDQDAAGDRPVEPEAAQTRQSGEIARLAPRLSVPQQKLALELMRAMCASRNADED